MLGTIEDTNKVGGNFAVGKSAGGLPSHEILAIRGKVALGNSGVVIIVSGVDDGVSEH